ncbi:MAG: VWA domain-containing protein, partial [Pseudomonadota bacterium]
MFFSRKFQSGLFAIAISTLAAPAFAAGSVAWLNPANGSTFPVGTVVTPDGQANASGTVGGGLDLVLVLDSSGSMGASVPLNIPNTPNPTRAQVQQQAANALVNALPAGSNVSVVDFDSSATVVQGLTPTPNSAINSAINGINASGGTNIGAGIAAADAELDANGNTANSQQILVISDGSSTQSIAEAAAAAAAADGYTVNSVGFPGANTTVLEAVANAGGGTFVNFNNNPQDIINI